MSRRATILLIGALALAGCSSTADPGTGSTPGTGASTAATPSTSVSPASSPQTSIPPTQPSSITVPEGYRLVDATDSEEGRTTLQWSGKTGHYAVRVYCTGGGQAELKTAGQTYANKCDGGEFGSQIISDPVRPQATLEMEAKQHWQAALFIKDPKSTARDIPDPSEAPKWTVIGGGGGPGIPEKNDETYQGSLGTSTRIWARCTGGGQLRLTLNPGRVRPKIPCNGKPWTGTFETKKGMTSVVVGTNNFQQAFAFGFVTK